ncbi:hypothetical protein F5X96DRAFT_45471 [Biscogniauxia mediterranea]|nr:hypothetical protein F5X96DRAFT_45471 [Biscogniauxia mediterranea]
MPSRMGLPKLNIFSSKTTSSSSVLIPPSPKHSAKRSTSTSMSPPARLHLRNVLPSSPNALPTPPPPPRQPYSWLWQCHSCSMVYRLGCTSRCLVCSHSYCVSANPPSTTGRGKKRRRSPGMCASEFDYHGWAEWGAWRRKVLGIEALGPAGAKKRERAFVTKTHNCWTDCDYPSECHHERYRIATEAVQNRYSSAEPLDEEPQSASRIASVPRCPDDELPLNVALELTEDEDEKSPPSPLSQTSFFGDETDDDDDNGGDDDDEEHEEQKKKEDKVWWVDASGQEKQRKIQSQRKVKQLTGAGSDELHQTGSPAATDSGKSRETKSLTRPRRNSVSSSSSSSSSISSKLTVRNLTDHEIWEDWSSDSSDSESDPDDGLFMYDSPGRNSNSSCSSSESDNDDDDEKENKAAREKWENVPLAAPPGASQPATRGKTQEEIDDSDDDDIADLAALLRARDAYLRLGESI